MNINPTDMKSNTEKVPDMDDLIFRDRNQEYGAYMIRKRYNSTMRISIVAGMIFGFSVVLVPFFTADREEVIPGHFIDITATIDNSITDLPDIPKPPDAPELPKEQVMKVQFTPPEIVSDGAISTDMMPADDLIDMITDETPVEVMPEVPATEAVTPPEPKPYVIVSEMPSFPGGREALMQYLGENIVYPEDAVKNNISGTVILKFVVRSDGKVTDIEVTRSAGELLDNEAVRVLSLMPLWRPGKQDGRPVPVYFSIPVVFAIR